MYYLLLKLQHGCIMCSKYSSVNAVGLPKKVLSSKIIQSSSAKVKNRTNDLRMKCFSQPSLRYLYLMTSPLKIILSYQKFSQSRSRWKNFQIPKINLKYYNRIHSKLYIPCFGLLINSFEVHFLEVKKFCMNGGRS